MTADSWRWEHRHGPAGDLHETTPPNDEGLTAWFLEVDAAALVLGSGQPAEVVDPERATAAGVSVVHRRSGGGAVLLVPGEHVWIDVWVHRSSRLWDDDVVRAVDWLADAWTAALGALGMPELDVHRSSLQRSRWSAQVCFAGLGPGEVSLGGRKLVGISQRRTRDWARLQCVVHRRWDAEATFGLLRDPDASAGAAQWRDGVAVIGDLDIAGALREVLDRA